MGRREDIRSIYFFFFEEGDFFIFKYQNCPSQKLVFFINKMDNYHYSLTGLFICLVSDLFRNLFNPEKYIFYDYFSGCCPVNVLFSRLSPTTAASQSALLFL